MRESSVHDASMSDIYRNQYALFISDFRQQPVTADAVSPIAFELSDQGLAEKTGIFRIQQVRPDPLFHHDLYGMTQSLKLFFKFRRRQ